MTVTAQAQAQPVQPGRRISPLSVGSWVLYDLANTIFSFAIVSFYFALWVSNVGGTDQAYGFASSISMALVFVSAPVLGALSDQAPRRLPFLVATTLVCVAFTALLGIGGLTISLVLFIIANYFYQAGLIFYDSLLPEVSTEENRGRIGGLGVGIGYLGSIVGLAVGFVLLGPDPEGPEGFPTVFRIIAALFLLFALPAFLFVRERPRRVPPFGAGAVRRAFGQLLQTTQRARKYRGLTRFLFGRIFYTDAANTLILFMAVYLTSELGFTLRDAQIVAFVTIPAAVVGGLTWGLVVDRLGPKRTLNIVLILWMLTLGLAMAIPVLNLSLSLVWVVGALAGIALGGTWSADRPYMLRLAPPRYLGQFYGLYAMVGRFSAITGPALWGLVVTTLGWGRPAAIGTLLVMVIISYIILQGVSDKPRTWSTDELEPE